MYCGDRRAICQLSTLNSRLPKWLAHVFRIGGKHDVEANAYSCFIASIGVHRVRQPGGKNQNGAVPHLHDDPIRVLCGQLRYRWFDDIRLGPRVVKVYGVGPRIRLYVVDTTQEIVGMIMHSMRGIRRVHVGPTTGYFKVRRADLQEVQDTPDRVVHTRRQFPEFIPFV